ncbi:MAG TPA: hypothetical protein VMW68_10215 [Methyloceanibacter sp.]|nr:hypothetical protein [Methyloceanibacter sp.]
MRRPHQLAIAAVLLTLFPDPAWAGVVTNTLQSKHQDEICHFENGVYRIDPRLLARRIVIAAAIGPDLLEHGNPPNDVISLVVKDEPFGTGSFAATPAALAARQRLLAARMELTGFLVLGDEKLANLDGYTVVNA